MPIISYFIYAIVLRHEESPKEPQYNMATPPFLDKPPHFAYPPPPPFSNKNFQTPSFPSILKKSNPPLYEGGGGIRTM